MALGDYTPTAWVNGSAPAISASNLLNIESKLDEIDAASAATSSTRIWSTANDGNAGQQPCPKPTAGTPTGGANAVGQYIAEDISSSTADIYPSGITSRTGTWEYQLIGFVAATGVLNMFKRGIASGASPIHTAASSVNYFVTTKRIA